MTVTGAGGTGKTRLGLQVAAELLEEFPGGVFFVPLAGVAQPELVASTIATQDRSPRPGAISATAPPCS